MEVHVPAFIFICCLMGMGESTETHIADESTLIDMVLEDIPVRKCDAIIVSRSPLLEDVGRSTIFFTSIDDLMALMGDREEFVKQHLSTMECFILESNRIMKSPLGHLAIWWRLKFFTVTI